MTATKCKRKVKEPQRCDDSHAQSTAQKLTRTNYKGYTYKNPIKILMRFEVDDHQRGIKLMNKTGQSFTKIVNLALKAYLKGFEVPEPETLNYPALTRDVYSGSEYEQAINILICFETSDHIRAYTVMNKFSITFTRVVNNALEAYFQTL